MKSRFLSRSSLISFSPCSIKSTLVQMTAVGMKRFVIKHPSSSSISFLNSSIISWSSNTLMSISSMSCVWSSFGAFFTLFGMNLPSLSKSGSSYDLQLSLIFYFSFSISLNSIFGVILNISSFNTYAHFSH
jgi:hypothetical protein